MAEPAPHSGARKAARNSLWLLLARLIDLAAALGVAAILARSLGVWGYGRYSFLLGLTQLAAPLVNLGLEQILLRENSRDIPGMRNRLTAGLGAVLSLALTISLLLVGGATLCGLGGIELLALILLLGSLTARQIFEVVIRSGILASEKAYFEVLLTSLFSIARLIIVGLISLSGGDLTALVAGLASADLGIVLGGLVIGWRVRFIGGKLDWQLGFKLIILAAPLGMAALLRNSSLYVDTMVLEGMKGSNEVGLFSAAYRPIVMATFILIPLLWPLLPGLARRSVAGNPMKEISQAFSILCFLSLGLALWGAIYTEEILRLLFGEDFIFAAPALSILAITPLLRAAGYLFDMGLVAANQTRRIAIIAVIVLVINLLMDFLLIPQWGAVGAAWATLCADFVGALVGVLLITRTWKESLTLPRGWAIPIAILCSTPCYFIPWSIWIKAALGLLVYFAVGITLGVVPKHLILHKHAPKRESIE